MKIHDRLLQVTEPGTVLTFREIRQKVWDAFPDTKPESIVPSEHTRGRKGICQPCHHDPLFEKLERGLYRVLPRGDRLLELTVHEKLVQVLADYRGQFLSAEALRQKLAEAFPDTHLLSFIPTDHMAGGSCRPCTQAPLLERTLHRGVYQVLPARHQGEHPLNQTREVAQILRQLFQRHPPESLQPDTVLQALEPSGGLSRRELNLLVSALRERVVIDLLEFSELMEREALHTRLSQRIYDNQGINPELARWSVETWAEALQGWQDNPYPVAPLSHQAVAEIQLPLIALEAVLLAPRVYWLKKHRRRIALLAYFEAGCILGVRPQLAAAILTPALTSYERKPNQLPLLLPLSRKETAAFTWYILPSEQLVKEVLSSLDQGFPFSAAPSGSF